MEDAWDDLGDVFANSKSKLIGEVDCTDDNARELCASEDVTGFPTLKWGSVFDLQEYGGPRDFENLKKFADKNLKPQCSPTHMQLCDKTTRREIRRLQKLSVTALDKEMDDKLEEVNKLERDFQTAVADLETQYETATAQRDADKKQLGSGDLILMKAVLAQRKTEL
ncbi:Protein disulfide isomerase [Seminavis robusta]|uniref:Protein disulfide isomerase n=1 Tax=Seminavis robusta TaxID=568900 RepID=A0A9N8EIG0_9STRA|nr:Protein disulfide isomerase [Seminavis robusta]|eukprot:Sro1186_g250410.1 Protein disulfide isomerase (167) ;mRNA; f:32090-32590